MWRTHLVDSTLVVDADGFSVAQVCGEYAAEWELMERRATLIAAAPDLLEALELADCLLSGANMNRKIVEQTVKAALAKAKGDTP